MSEQWPSRKRGRERREGGTEGGREKRKRRKKEKKGRTEGGRE